MSSGVLGMLCMVYYFHREQYSHETNNASLVLTNIRVGGGHRSLLMSSSGSCMRIEMELDTEPCVGIIWDILSTQMDSEEVD